MSGIQKLNPFRLHQDVQVKDKSQLAQAMEQAEKGRLGHRDVANLTPEQILGEFRHTAGSALRQVASDALIGARKASKIGLKVGAAVGAATGIAAAITGGVSFPPSLIAMGITVALGAAKGAVLGGATGFALGGLFKGTKTALYLAFTTPKQRLNRASRKGRTELNRMERKLMQDKAPENKKARNAFNDRLAFLRQHVPLWEYAAVNLKDVDCSPKARKSGLSQPETVEHSASDALIKWETSATSESTSSQTGSPPKYAEINNPLLQGPVVQDSLLLS